MIHCNILQSTFRNIGDFVDCFDNFCDSCNFNQREKFEGYENMGQFMCRNVTSKCRKQWTYLTKPETTHFYEERLNHRPDSD